MFLVHSVHPSVPGAPSTRSCEAPSMSTTLTLSCTAPRNMRAKPLSRSTETDDMLPKTATSDMPSACTKNETIFVCDVACLISTQALHTHTLACTESMELSSLNKARRDLLCVGEFVNNTFVANNECGSFVIFRYTPPTHVLYHNTDKLLLSLLCVL